MYKMLSTTQNGGGTRDFASYSLKEKLRTLSELINDPILFADPYTVIK